jgi:hypothetical protein
VHAHRQVWVVAAQQLEAHQKALWGREVYQASITLVSMHGHYQVRVVAPGHGAAHKADTEQCREQCSAVPNAHISQPAGFRGTC